MMDKSDVQLNVFLATIFKSVLDFWVDFECKQNRDISL